MTTLGVCEPSLRDANNCFSFVVIILLAIDTIKQHTGSQKKIRLLYYGARKFVVKAPPRGGNDGRLKAGLQTASTQYNQPD